MAFIDNEAYMNEARTQAIATATATATASDSLTSTTKACH